MENVEAYKNAKKKVEAKVKFKTHLTVYIMVNVLLLIINLVTSTEYLWFIWPLMGWGIAIIVHAINVYAFTNATDVTEEMITRQMEKDAKR